MISFKKKNKSVEYPLISISDCYVERIMILEQSVSIRFKDKGFWIREGADEEWHRVSKSTVQFNDCIVEDTNFVSISILKLFNKAFKYVREIDFHKLASKVNSEEWKLEVVQDYVSETGSFFVCRLQRKKGIREYAYLEVRHNEMGFEYSANN